MSIKSFLEFPCRKRVLQYGAVILSGVISLLLLFYGVRFLVEKHLDTTNDIQMIVVTVITLTISIIISAVAAVVADWNDTHLSLSE